MSGNAYRCGSLERAVKTTYIQPEIQHPTRAKDVRTRTPHRAGEKLINDSFIYSFCASHLST